MSRFIWGLLCRGCICICRFGIVGETSVRVCMRFGCFVVIRIETVLFIELLMRCIGLWLVCWMYVMIVCVCVCSE